MHHTQQKKQTANHYFVAFVALFGMLVSGLSIDIYVPSLPAVTAHFGVDKGLVQFTITTYLIGFGVTQLFIGSFSDSVGRKIPLITATSAFTLISILIPFSHTIYQLQLLRLLQGIAVACVNVPTRTIIADLFEGAEFYKMMNYATLAWALGPIIAPAIGGYLQHYVGWQAPFYFLAAYGLLLLILYLLFLPETIKSKRPFNAREMVRCYWELLFNKDYILGLVCLGSVYAMLILFGVVAPFFIQNVLHYSAVQFGHMALLAGLSWFIGNMSNRFLLHLDLAMKIRICLSVMLIITAVMLVFAVNDAPNIYSIIIPTMLLFFCGGIIYPSYFAQNVALFRHIPGYANGLMGAVIILIGSLGSTVGIFLKSHSQVPLTLAYVGIAVICLVCSLLIKHQAIHTKQIAME